MTPAWLTTSVVSPAPLRSISTTASMSARNRCFTTRCDEWEVSHARRSSQRHPKNGSFNRPVLNGWMTGSRSRSVLMMGPV